MVRLLWILTLAVGLAAAYFGILERNSFSDFSSEKLAVLAEGYRAQLGESRKVADENAVSLSLLEDEQLRRKLAPALTGATGLCVLLALLATRRRGPRPERLSGESARLKEALGDPAVIEAGARQKAAALLGVTVEAPIEVVNAAFEAQRRQYELPALEGLAPDLRRMMQDKRVALEKARELLVSPTTRSAS